MKRLLPLCTLCILSSAHPVLAAEKSGMELSPLSEPRSAITLGLLQGASLIGFDHERLLTDRVGFQFGAGLLGFDCGLLTPVWGTVARAMTALAAGLAFTEDGLTGDARPS